MPDPQTPAIHDRTQPNTWRCTITGCPLDGQWRAATPNRSAYETWAEHYRTEHQARQP